MIDTQGVVKSLGNLQASKSVDLHVDKGEVVSIMGLSGAGKTTLLQIIGTFDQPDDGQVKMNNILFDGLSSDKLNDFHNRHINFAFQFHQLLSRLTVLENVLIPTYITGKGRGKAKRRVQGLLGFIGPTDRAHHKSNQLLDGEKQRVAVARVPVNHLAMILVDEPSGSLDSENKAGLYQLLLDLRDEFGQILAIVTHDGGLTTLTDRTIHVENGKLIGPQATDIEPTENKEQ